MNELQLHFYFIQPNMISKISIKRCCILFLNSGVHFICFLFPVFRLSQSWRWRIRGWRMKMELWSVSSPNCLNKTRDSRGLIYLSLKCMPSVTFILWLNKQFCRGVLILNHNQTCRVTAQLFLVYIWARNAAYNMFT